MSDDKIETMTATCQCGAEIYFEPPTSSSETGAWYHTRIEDGSHQATPLTNQPPERGRPNFDYLQSRFEEELAAEQHLKQGQTEERVEAYRAHVEEIESPGYVPPDMSSDTLPEWLYNRLRKQGLLDDDGVDMIITHAVPWAELSDDDQMFWVHEAAAIRRAVARDGFKDYDSELSKR